MNIKTQKVLKISMYIIGAIVLTVWLYLIALNNRYMFASIEGDDFIIDKWTKEVYGYRGETTLTNMKIILDERVW